MYLYSTLYSVAIRHGLVSVASYLPFYSFRVRKSARNCKEMNVHSFSVFVLNYMYIPV